MTLYIRADHLDRAAQDFQSINILVDLITSHVANADIFDPDELDERDRIIHALIAVSDIAENAHARTTAALASAYMKPHDFKGESFKA